MASLLDKLKKRVEGVVAQANPFDNGASYNTVLQGRQPTPSPQVPIRVQRGPSFVDFQAVQPPPPAPRPVLRVGSSQSIQEPNLFQNIVRHGPSAIGDLSVNDVRNAAVGVGRSFARIPETASRSWMELTGGQQQSVGPATDPIRRTLYGSEPIETYQKRAKGIHEASKKPGGVPTISPLVAGLALPAMDLTPGGKPKNIRVGRTASQPTQGVKGQKPTLRVGKNQSNQPLTPPPLVGQSKSDVGSLPVGAGKVRVIQQSTQAAAPPQPPKLTAGTGSFDNTVPQKTSVVNDTNRNIQGGNVMDMSLPQSFADASNIDSAIKESVGAFGGKYTQKANKDLWNNARYRVATNFDEAMDFYHSTNNDESVATGYALVETFVKNGKQTEANRVLADMAERAVEAGRQTQAYSIMKRMSPESIVMSAEKRVAKWANDPKNIGKTPNWNDTKRTQLYQMAEQLKTIPEGRQRNLLIGQMQQMIDDIFPSSVADRAITVWKAGLLTALRTHERNILSNAINMSAEQASTVPGSIVDRLMGLRTGQRSLVVTRKGLGEGGKEGAGVAADLIRTGIDVTGDRLKHNIGHVTWGNNKVEQTLKAYTEAVFRTLAAEDKIPRFAGQKNSLYNQAIASAKTKGLKGEERKQFIDNFVQNPTRKVAETAQQEGARGVFGHDTALGSAISEGKRAIKQKSALGGAVTDVVVPFTQVPSGVGAQLVAYSPAGFAKGMYDVGKVLVTGSKDLQRLAAQRFGRGATGTAILGAGAYLMSKGLMTGKPADDKERARWETEGKQASSVKVGDRWYNIGSIGPQTILMLAAGQAQQAMQAGENPANLVAAIGQNYKNQTFLKGMSSALDAIGDPKRYASAYVQGQAASIVPNIVKDVARGSDNVQRQVNSVGNAFRNSFPGARQSLPANYDILGRPVPNPGGFPGALLDLFNSRQQTGTPVTNLLDQLGRTDEPGNPVQIPKTIKINGESQKLNSEQMSGLQQFTGTRFNEASSKLLQDPNFIALPDNEKSKKLNNLYSDIFAAGKIQMLNNQPKTISENVKRILGGESPVLASSAAPGLPRQHVDFLSRVATMSDEQKEKVKYDEPDFEYKQALANYENDKLKGKISKAEEIKKQGELLKMKVGSTYNKEVREFYGLNKTQLYNYLTNDPNGQAIADQIIALDDAMVANGAIAKNKFRDKYGNIDFDPGSSGGGGGGKGGKGKAFNAVTIKSPETPQLSSVKVGKPSGQLAKKPGVTKIAKRKPVRIGGAKIKGAVG